MSNGCFIADKLLNVRLNLMVGLDSEWLSYDSGDKQSYTIVIATPIHYDKNSGVLTFVNDNGNEFYIHEDGIEIFWRADSGFNLEKSTTSTVKPKKNVNIDIMNVRTGAKK